MHKSEKKSEKVDEKQEVKPIFDTVTEEELRAEEEAPAKEEEDPRKKKLLRPTERMELDDKIDALTKQLAKMKH